LTSKLYNRLSHVLTMDEKLAAFAPLKKFVAKGLAEQRDELVSMSSNIFLPLFSWFVLCEAT
jgi:hypothetical protein